jgi:hypothetical protein
MPNLILALAVVCAGVSCAFYTANDTAGSVPHWASDVCSAAEMLCHQPEQLAFAAAGLAALWLIIKFVSAVRD